MKIEKALKIAAGARYKPGRKKKVPRRDRSNRNRETFGTDPVGNDALGHVLHPKDMALVARSGLIYLARIKSKVSIRGICVFRYQTSSNGPFLSAMRADVLRLNDRQLPAVALFERGPISGNSVKEVVDMLGRRS